MGTRAVEVSALSKYYKAAAPDSPGLWGALFGRRQTVCAVDDISFAIETGEIVGLLGSNGAGKTTAIKCLTGILVPTHGKVRVLGFDPYRDRYRYSYNIGLILGQKSQLLWDVPVIESYKLYRDVYEVADSDFRRRLGEYSDMLDLHTVLKTPVRKLSLGQRMRAEFVAALLHNPKVIFLDEPTLGLDVVAKDRIRQFLLEVNRAFGTTVILTTHDMRDVESLCRRVLLLEAGKLVYNGAISTLKDLENVRVMQVSYSAIVDHRRFEELSLTWHVSSTYERGMCLHVPQGEIVQCLQRAMAALDITDVTVEAPSLEQIMRKILERGLGNVPHNQAHSPV